MRLDLRIPLLACCGLLARGVAAWAADPPAAGGARVHLEGAAAHAGAARWDAAAREYRLALAVRTDAVVLWDLAQAERLAGHGDEARMFYRLFLRLSPRSPLRFAARGQVLRLDSKAAGQAVPPTDDESDAAWARLVTDPRAPAERDDEPDRGAGGATAGTPASTAAEPGSAVVASGAQRVAPTAPLLPPEPPASHPGPGRAAELGGAALVLAGAVVVGGSVGFGVAADRLGGDTSTADTGGGGSGRSYTITSGVLAAVGFSALIVGGSLFEHHRVRSRERPRPGFLVEAARAPFGAGTGATF